MMPWRHTCILNGHDFGFHTRILFRETLFDGQDAPTRHICLKKLFSNKLPLKLEPIVKSFLKKTFFSKNLVESFFVKIYHFTKFFWQHILKSFCMKSIDFRIFFKFSIKYLSRKKAIWIFMSIVMIVHYCPRASFF